MKNSPNLVVMVLRAFSQQRNTNTPPSHMVLPVTRQILFFDNYRIRRQGWKEKVDMLYYWSDVTQVVKNYTWKTSCTIYKLWNWVFESLFIIHIFPILLCVYVVSIKIILKVCFRKNPLHTRLQCSCERLVCRMVHIRTCNKTENDKTSYINFGPSCATFKVFFIYLSAVLMKFWEKLKF